MTETQFFQTVYDQYYQGMWRYAHHLSGSKAAADDIVQDVFRKLLSKEAVLKKLNDYQRKAYIVIAIKNKAKDYWREKVYDALPEDDILPSKEKSPEEIFFRGWEASRIKKAVHSLSDKCRDTIVALYELDLSVMETASLLDVSIDVIYKRKKLALEKLKQLLGGELDE